MPTDLTLHQGASKRFRGAWNLPALKPLTPGLDCPDWTDRVPTAHFGPLNSLGVFLALLQTWSSRHPLQESSSLSPPPPSPRPGSLGWGRIVGECWCVEAFFGLNCLWEGRRGRGWGEVGAKTGQGRFPEAELFRRGEAAFKPEVPVTWAEGVPSPSLGTGCCCVAPYSYVGAAPPAERRQADTGKTGRAALKRWQEAQGTRGFPALMCL